MPTKRTTRRKTTYEAVDENLVQQMHEQDQAAAKKADEDMGERTTMPLAKILKRISNTRPIDENHVENILVSIITLGLLEPLVVDLKGRLLAGAHRLSAIEKLAASKDKEKKAAFKKHFPDGMIPVYIKPFVTEENPDLAIRIEVAENEHRKNYTPREVCRLAEKLLATNRYHYHKGQTPNDKTPLIPTLEAIIGQSRRTVSRHLKLLNEKENMAFGEGDKTKANVSPDPFRQPGNDLQSVRRWLRAANASLEKLEESPKRAALLKKIPGILKDVEAAIVELLDEKNALDKPSPLDEKLAREATSRKSPATKSR